MKYIRLIVLVLTVIGALAVVRSAAADIGYYDPDKSEYYWQIESTNDEEITNVYDIGGGVYRFQIIPTDKLSVMDQITYPIETYTITVNELGEEIKTPLKILPSAKLDTSVKNIDLTKTDYIDINIPDDLDRLFVKLGPHSVVYSGVTNVITVTGGTPGAPITYTDIYNADVAGGWGVFVNSGSCNRCYCSSAMIQYGVSGSTTYFQDYNTTVSFSDNLNPGFFAYIQNVEPTNTTVIWGQQPNNGIINNGMVFNSELSESFYNFISDTGNNLEICNTYINCNGFATILGGTRTCYSTFNNLGFTQRNNNLDHCVFTVGFTPIYQSGASLSLNNSMISAQSGLLGSGLHLGGPNPGTLTHRACTVLNTGTYNIYNLNMVSDVNLIDWVFPQNDWVVNMADNQPGIITRQHSFNAIVMNGSGAALNGCLVEIWDINDNLVTSVSTTASGTITEQILNYGYWDHAHLGTPTMSTPHTIRITRDGYIDYEQVITMDHPVNLEVALQTDTSNNLIGWIQSNVIDWLGGEIIMIAQILLAAILVIFPLIRQQTMSWVISAIALGMLSSVLWETEIAYGIGLAMISVMYLLKFSTALIRREIIL